MNTTTNPSTLLEQMSNHDTDTLEQALQTIR